MTVALTCHIVFHANSRRKQDLVLNQVTELEFESSYKLMTDRGSLTIPRKVRFFDRQRVKEVFKRGDAITIYFGYNGVNIKEFEGYITEVSADIPIVIKFEDEMFMIKKIPVNFSASKTTLENLFKKILPDHDHDVLEGVELGGVRFSKTTVGPVLDKLQSDWNLYTYMKGKQIVCGKYYADDSDQAHVTFHLERNCVSTQLNYKSAEDVSVKIKCVSTLANGEKVTVEDIGDKDGSERQLTFYNISDKKELERLGEIEYKKYKQDRYDGSFTAFGIPSVVHGLKCNVLSTLYEERQGLYYIEKVVKEFGPGGIRQEITLGEKV